MLRTIVYHESYADLDRLSSRFVVVKTERMDGAEASTKRRRNTYEPFEVGAEVVNYSADKNYPGANGQPIPRGEVGTVAVVHKPARGGGQRYDIKWADKQYGTSAKPHTNLVNRSQ